ncbi:MAG: D-arabinono-1,4-lactone oxidase [Nevskiales bacterium]
MAISRRGFFEALASVGALTATAPWLPVSAQAVAVWRNWSGAQSALPAAQLAPGSESELAALIAGTRQTVRPVGSAHSFSALVPTRGMIVSLARLQGLISHDAARLQAEFWGGTHMSTMGPVLHEIGQAQVNMADIDYQTLAGAIATSTHGTGKRFGSYSSTVTGLRLITAQGEILDCDADNQPELFKAACCSLGALGVISRIRLQNRKPFRLHSKTWVAETESLLENLDHLATANAHFELLPLAHSDKSLAIAHNETYLEPSPKQEAESDAELAQMMDALYRHLRHMPKLRSQIINFVAGRLSFEEEIDDSWKVFANQRDVRFNEMEYSVPAEDGPACLREILKTIADNNLPSWFPLEYRLVKADDVPLSMFYKRDSAAISVHQYHELDYHNFFAAIEPIFWKYGGRPHWGKLHRLNARQLSGLYPEWDRFNSIRKTLDPQGKFLNDHLRGVFGA